jgi:hypothetical protein
VRPALTVYSRNDSPDPNVAPRVVLAALNPGNPGQVDKIMAQRSGAFTQAGLSTTQATPGGATIAPGSDLGGRTFEIDVDATYARHHVTRRVVLVLTGDATRPYLVEAWE